MTKIKSFGERFWSKVNKTDNCWEWTGAIGSNGYGIFVIKLGKIQSGKWSPAHRVAWESINGKIPEGMQICHKCDNRKCVKFDHLFLGTRKDNMQDAVKKGRMSFGENRYNHKLIDSDIVKIHILHWINGLSYSRIGRLFGVSPTLLCNLIKGRTWKHIR